MPRLTFRSGQRLTHARQFEAVYEARVQRARGPLMVYGRPNGLTRSRLGLSVGRRVGGATVRNKAKRVVREAFRLSQREIPVGLDFVVSVRPRRGDEGLELEECRGILVDLAGAIAREWERRKQREESTDGGVPR